VPPKGSPDGWEKRNGHLGETWTFLLPDEKAVFSPEVFQCLSNIPCTLPNDEDPNNDEIKLTKAVKEIYQPLYQHLVNHNKVNSIVSKGADLITNQISILKQAQGSLTKLNVGVSPQFLIKVTL
jgi:hypothetical protein